MREANTTTTLIIGTNAEPACKFPAQITPLHRHTEETHTKTEDLRDTNTKSQTNTERPTARDMNTQRLRQLDTYTKFQSLVRHQMHCYLPTVFFYV